MHIYYIRLCHKLSVEMKCIALPLNHYSSNLYNVYTIQVISTDSKNTLWNICIHAYAIDILIAC